jgi:hypothetical protein
MQGNCVISQFIPFVLFVTFFGDSYWGYASASSLTTCFLYFSSAFPFNIPSIPIKPVDAPNPSTLNPRAYMIGAHSKRSGEGVHRNSTASSSAMVLIGRICRLLRRGVTVSNARKLYDCLRGLTAPQFLPLVSPLSRPCPALVPPLSRPCPALVPPLSRPCPALVPPLSRTRAYCHDSGRLGGKTTHGLNRLQRYAPRRWINLTGN